MGEDISVLKQESGLTYEWDPVTQPIPETQACLDDVKSVGSVALCQKKCSETDNCKGYTFGYPNRALASGLLQMPYTTTFVPYCHQGTFGQGTNFPNLWTADGNGYKSYTTGRRYFSGFPLLQCITTRTRPLGTTKHLPDWFTFNGESVLKRNVCGLCLGEHTPHIVVGSPDWKFGVLRDWVTLRINL